ncbi:hypothetical protein EXIGLDRAFT_693309 [Exidia glandulosa HHB12029]|uniref:Uncharacterized protein n=1 Tax=Exidia glandulosa HHB12029 TaxID=1314781 RepID=A0A165HDB1_EXIGL|nr:hypothetical protein EXIGLDRAFT_693309 [Exidia glandulosa HHB12029]
MSFSNAQSAMPPSYTTAATEAPALTLPSALDIPFNASPEQRSAVIALLNQLSADIRRVIIGLSGVDNETRGMNYTLDGLFHLVSDVEELAKAISEGLVDIHEHLIDITHRVDLAQPFLQRIDARVNTLLSNAAVNETAANLQRVATNGVRDVANKNAGALSRLEEAARNHEANFATASTVIARLEVASSQQSQRLAATTALLEVSAKNIAAAVEDAKNEIIALTASFRLDVAVALKDIREEMHSLRVYQSDLAKSLGDFLVLNRELRDAVAGSPPSPLSPLTPSPPASTVASTSSSTSANSPVRRPRAILRPMPYTTQKRIAKSKAKSAITALYNDIDGEDELVDDDN